MRVEAKIPLAGNARIRLFSVFRGIVIVMAGNSRETGSALDWIALFTIVEFNEV
jgi:hypothetical protein